MVSPEGKEVQLWTGARKALPGKMKYGYENPRGVRLIAAGALQVSGRPHQPGRCLQEIRHLRQAALVYWVSQPEVPA